MTLSRILIGAAAPALVILAVTGGFARAVDNPRGLDPTEDELDRASTLLPNNAVLPPIPQLPSAPDVGSDSGEKSGNPLWGITIESLHATRERPLFTPSRRPPTPAAISPLSSTPVRPQQSSKPEFSLLGTVAGDGVGYAVFLDNATHDIVRLKTGEGQDGWILRSVTSREAVLVKDDRTAVMRLPTPTGELK
jgi:hypothetical protein